MAKLIPAGESLRYPCAQLTEEEQKIADKIIAEINGALYTNMRLNGFQFTTNNNNPAAMVDVLYQLQKGGYMVNCKVIAVANRFDPRGTVEINGYELTVTPTMDSITESRQQSLH